MAEPREFDQFIAVMEDLWREVGSEPTNRLLMRRETFELLRTAYREGVRRRRRVRTVASRSGMLNRGINLRERTSKMTRRDERRKRRYA